MGEYKQPKKVKLLIPILLKDKNQYIPLRTMLEKEFGAIEEELLPIPFVWTNYYEKELGEKPFRAILAFENLMDREKIVEIKRLCNEWELQDSIGGLRNFNLDPGYMTLGQFFLATTKDQRHRVYLGQGIFVEPTLYYEAGEFKAFYWTYRDYQSTPYLEFFKLVRSRLAFHLKTGYLYRERLSQG